MKKRGRKKLLLVLSFLFCCLTFADGVRVRNRNEIEWCEKCCATISHPWWACGREYRVMLFYFYFVSFFLPKTNGSKQSSARIEQMETFTKAPAENETFHSEFTLYPRENIEQTQQEEHVKWWEKNKINSKRPQQDTLTRVDIITYYSIHLQDPRIDRAAAAKKSFGKCETSARDTSWDKGEKRKTTVGGTKMFYDSLARSALR